MKRFLFIGHEATRSGAPFVLLHLLRWIKKHRPECELDLLLLAGGELEPEYRKVANVQLLKPPKPRNIVAKKILGIRSRFDDELRLGVSGLPLFQNKYDVVIGNTAVTLRHLRLFKRRGFTTAGWMHELDGALESLGLAAEFSDLAQFVDRFIVGSNAVGDMLRRRGISTQVDRIYEFSPPLSEATFDPAAIRAEIGLSAGTFVIGACGTIEYRKGTDLFVRLADRLRSHTDFHFIWVGRSNGEQDPLFAEVAEMIERLQLGDRLTILKAAGSSERYLAAIDLFVLTSREDPFPLVCLDAANLGKPVICFAGAGGMAEFVGNDAGAVVPFGNVDDMAASIERFYLDPYARKRAGDVAKHKAQTDFSAELSCSKLFAVLSGL
ncbi:MAG: glycosyltransferase family 4 protein [Acidobacteriota bacterium]